MIKSTELISDYPPCVHYEYIILKKWKVQGEEGLHNSIASQNS